MSSGDPDDDAGAARTTRLAADTVAITAAKNPLFINRDTVSSDRLRDGGRWVVSSLGSYR